ncbi:MAG: hypothetical protein NC041_03840 [Bacteroides sp.]|nr:hypothetical protein [Prevotella sp.]MCM1408256.1 hypothetical protein [Treponema brennaborense]MCM1469580.1 hypothetical protein [Bacteroides sp.]
MSKSKKPGLFFYVSALAFFCLEFAAYRNLAAIPFALAALFFVCGKIDFAEVLRCSKKMRVFCLLNAAGVCICGAKTFYFLTLLEAPMSRIRAFVISHGILREYTAACYCAAVLGALVGFYFVFVLNAAVCKRLYALVSELGLLEFSRAQKITYAALFAACAVLIGAVYVQSDAFFPQYPEKANDVVFSADGQLHIVQDNAFLKLQHCENDIRQPLFSVFATPFCAVPYLVSCALPFRWALPLFTALANLALLLFSVRVLARLLHLRPLEEILFALASSCMYSHVVFSLLIEQYIIATMYLFLLLYAFCERRRLDTFALYAAAGTLSTSCAAAIVMCKKETLSERVKRLFLLALGFVFVCIVLDRGDIFFNLIQKGTDLSRFTGVKAGVPFCERFLQFLHSVPYYFVSPDAAVSFVQEAIDEYGNVTPAHFQYAETLAASVSFAGIVLLVLCALSMLLNRKDSLARFSAFWIVFNFLLTCVVGWGYGENSYSLFLYVLYFGWPYPVLLVLLVQKIAQALKAHWIVPAALSLSCAALLWFNIPSVKQLIDFALAYYPL